MENKEIKIKDTDTNMLDVYSKKFAELQINLENLNEVQLAQIKYLCKDVEDINKRADVLLVEKCVPDGTTKIQINNEKYYEVIRHPAREEVVDVKNFDNKAIITYIVENKIDWTKELPIDYKELENKPWFKEAISRGAKLYTTTATTKQVREFKKTQIKKIEGTK